VAVPTGDYDLIASVDLSPVFGVLTYEGTVSVRRPGADVLGQRLRELAGDDAKARRRALLDLRYFPDHGDRVVPALIGVLEGDDENLKYLALSVLGSYPKEVAGHLDLILGIATGKGKDNERGGAAYLLARVAPKKEEYEKALAEGVESSEGYMKRRFESALKLYRRRHPPPGPREEGRLSPARIPASAASHASSRRRSRIPARSSMWWRISWRIVSISSPSQSKSASVRAISRNDPWKRRIRERNASGSVRAATSSSPHSPRM